MRFFLEKEFRRFRRKKKDFNFNRLSLFLEDLG